jgi:Tol biopolymer transport system component/predicted Ser/Thr protein kinase
MPLSAGDRLGPYEILASIGAGGMGEVYRAKDTKLRRDVAIKVLPEAFAQDTERLARFTREAQVLASLNHPNIAAIYGVEDRALVMELVEGPTLAERIELGPVPLEESLQIAAQIAEAVEYAHEKGVVHRDLKPANIKISPEDAVKILDFGLAKALSDPTAMSTDSGNSPTLTMGATQVGMILGTAAYMSPEQARGKSADRRSDIWAFGVVLHEMLTGKHLYSGEMTSDILAAVIAKEPVLDRVPNEVRPIIEKCLRKDPRKRWQSMGDVRLALEERTTDSMVEVTPVTKTGARWQIAAGALAVALAVALWAPWRTAAPVDRPLMRLNVDLGPEAVVGANITAAISPDAKRFAYPARSQDGKQLLATRLLDQAKPTLLTGTENATDPFFSPDGQWIGFFADNKMKKISVQGGAPVVLGDSSNARGASWGDDGTIVAELVNTAGLVRVSAAGGAARPLTTLRTGEATHRWPQVLPGGQTVLFTTNNNISAFDEATIEALSLKTNQRKTLWQGGYFGRYLPANGSRGYLVYIHQGTLFGAPFDLARLELQGNPVPLLDDVASDPTTAGGQLDVAALPGTLVYRSGKAVARTWPVMWLDTSGKTQPLLQKPGTYYTPSISPDGRHLAVVQESGKDQDAWIYDAQRDSMSRLTYNSSGGLYPVWSPDGKYIVFQLRSSGATAIEWIRSDGAGEAQRLLEGKNELFPGSLSPDGRRLAYTELSSETGFDLWTVTLDLSDAEHPKAGKPEPFLRTPFNERDPAFSPDGRWIAYTSTESGIGEVYVRPFPGPGGKWQISTGGAEYPKWSRSGHALFYETPTEDRIMVADYTATADSFSASKPREAANAQMIDAAGVPNWDLAPDGKRFVVFPAPEPGARDRGSVHVTFLLNFFDDLRRRIPTRR